MVKIKSWLNKFLFYLRLPFYKKYILKIDIKKPIYIFDIDNTLAIQKLNDVPNLNNPPINYYIKQVIENVCSNTSILYFTARNIKHKAKTISWLKNHQVLYNSSCVFFMPSPLEKLELIKWMLNRKYKITYYDDLSYNHQNGKILFYNSIIAELKKMPLQYFGVENIKIVY